MLDFSHLPNAVNGADVQLFQALGASDWQLWQRPRGKSMAYVLMIGAGSGGGGGASGAAGTGRAGGGGGASGGIHKVLLPLEPLGDCFYLRVPVGGAGGTPGVAGGTAALGLVALRPDVNTSQLLLSSYAIAPGAGGGGSTASPGQGGVVGTVATTPVGISWGLLAGSLPGVAGLGGGGPSGAVGGSPAAYGTQILTPGAGGGGCVTSDFGGGNVSGTGVIPSVLGPTQAGVSGAPGGFYAKGPLQHSYAAGGTGGASCWNGIAGNGGNGGIGCGGGGGGGGVTGGMGGSGGNGLIMIVSW